MEQAESKKTPSMLSNLLSTRTIEKIHPTLPLAELYDLLLPFDETYNSSSKFETLVSFEISLTLLSLNYKGYY